jgi:hypothetical protein
MTLTGTKVKSYWLKPYSPSGSDGSLPSILTMYSAYIPSDKVDELRLQISTPTSQYFKGASGVPGELANFTVPSFPPDFEPDPNSGLSGSGGSGGNSGDTRLKAVIGVCSGVAGIILIILGIWRYKVSRNRRFERAAARQRVFASRRRGYGTLDDGDDGQEIMYERDPSSVLDISPDPIRRRESFYHAADALREHQREIRRSQAYQLPPNYKAIIAAHTTPDGARGQREMTDRNPAPIYDAYRRGVHFDSSPESSS